MQIPGRKVNMIFSICQIRQFSETTDCLQDEIIVFVNKIVKIIHECTKRWEGVPTNNNGDKYILTWRLPTSSDVTKRNDVESSREITDNAENIPSQEVTRQRRPDAPWAKDEVEDFEELTEADIPGIKERLSD